MTSESKRLLQSNVRALLERKGGKLGAKETGVTRLVNLGISQGTAQRVFDSADSRLSTLDEVAAALGVSVGELMSPAVAAQALPYRDLDPFEAQLVTFFRQLPSDTERNELLVALSQRPITLAPPAAGSWVESGRRVKDVGNIPERRKARLVRR